ncbi:MAG: response regulator [Oscillospiraceae bacterium]|nr:response regulator [Oscillospiraceae bacterium]
MYRVVLIDDEQIIVKGLSRVVKWQEYNCEVVGTAYNAADGLALIRELRPDIVFTDIRMPDQDGLTMLAGLVNDYPNMQITVLTGFRDFSYAQEAIRLGVTRFLLKPSKMDELHEALHAMTEKLDKLGPPREEPEEEDASSPLSGSFVVKQAISYMEQNYQKKLTLQDVADHCFVSQWHLSKLINKHAEKSYYDLLNSIRIDRAKELLLDPSLKIGDIVGMVGFSDNAHFARIFKKIVGMSANEYRNQLK